MTKVTTIIPAYNAEEFIREAVDSALAQTHREHEIIVVDDGSTDGTVRALRSYGDPVYVLQQSNAGPAAARNAGAALASGEWLAFLDSDDIWCPEKLERQLDLAAKTGATWVYSDCRTFGDTRYVAEFFSRGVTFCEGDVFEPLLNGGFIPLSTAMVTRTAFNCAGGFDEAPAIIGTEDWDLWLRLAQTEHLRLCPLPLAHYRIHAGGISRSVDRMRTASVNVLNRALGTERGRQLGWRQQRKVFASLWRRLGWGTSERSPYAAIPYYLRSLWCDPMSRLAWKNLAKSLLGHT